MFYFILDIELVVGGVWVGVFLVFCEGKLFWVLDFGVLFYFFLWGDLGY